MGERAGIWQRVSTGGQDEASQLPDLIRWCESHGYEVAERYEVHGKSAFKGKQDAHLSRAFDDMASGKFTVLVVWSADRIERRGALAALKLAERAHSAGGRIEYVKDEYLNAANDLSDTMLALAGDMARIESRRKGDRILAKHAALRAAGSITGRPPWGYRIETRDGRKVLTPTDHGRTYIPPIFQAVIDGRSLPDVADWLTAEGVPTVAGRPWNPGYLSWRMIKNPTYYGQRPNGGQLETEALVSASTWQAANAALTARVRPGRGTVTQPKALLSPVCAKCYGKPREGAPSGISRMYRITTRGNVFYRCHGHGPQKRGCGNMVKLAELEAEVTASMLANDLPHAGRVFVPGDDRADAIARLRERGADALRSGDYGAATEAMQEAEALEALPSVAPHWAEAYECRSCGTVPSFTDCMIAGHSMVTEADWFGGLDHDERRAALAEYEITAERIDGEVRATIVHRSFTA